jgi:hypothetical protein
MKIFNASASLVFFLLFASNLSAQQPAPTLNPEPLERPRPLATVDSADASAVLAAIVAKLKASDFVIQLRDPKSYLVEARRFYDPKRAADCDRIIIWLAREIAAPNQIDAYLLYARYIQVFGRGNSVNRILLEEGKEDEYIGDLKRGLTETLTALGGHK